MLYWVPRSIACGGLFCEGSGPSLKVGWALISIRYLLKV